MAVTLSTPTVAALTSSGVTTTVSFTSTSQPLYVRIAGWANGFTFTSVTYGGTALAKIADSGLSNAQDFAHIWRLSAPTAGTANLVLTASGGNPSGNVSAANTTGQSSTTPEGTAATNVSAAAGTTTGNLAISGAATGDLTIAVVADGGGVAITPSATGGGTVTEEWDSSAFGEEGEGFKVPDAVTAVSATFTSQTWAIAAITLKVSGGVAAPQQQLTLLGVGV